MFIANIKTFKTDLKVKKTTKFSTALRGLLQRVDSASSNSQNANMEDIIVRCPLGRQPVTHKPLGRVLFH